MYNKKGWKLGSSNPAEIAISAELYNKRISLMSTRRC